LEKNHDSGRVQGARESASSKMTKDFSAELHGEFLQDTTAFNDAIARDGRIR